jgi:hypothetical protein
LRRVLDLGVFAEISNENHFVDAFSCHEDSLRSMATICGRIFDKYTSFD